MNKQLQLQIPVPCHENWNNMTPENQGRFCMSCQKTVVDFTAMTDYELIQYFKKVKGNTCGRFTEDQLHTKYDLESKKRLNWFKYFIHILFPTLLISTKSYSQGLIKSKPTVCNTPIRKGETIPILMGKPAFIQPAGEITGKVTNERDEVLAGANVFIKGTEEGLTTDGDGNFILRTKRDFPLTLTVSYVGYESFELIVDEKEAKSPLKVTLKEKTMEEVVVISYGTISCRSVMGAVMTSTYVTLYEDVKSKIFDSLKISSTKIYPNPLRKTSLLTIEMKSKTNGNYTVLVTDIGGRHLQMEQFSVESASIQKQIRLKQSIAQGVYIVSIIDPRGKRLSSQKVIVMD